MNKKAASRARKRQGRRQRAPAPSGQTAHPDELEVLALEKEELRAFVNFLRTFYSASSIIVAVSEAHRISENGELVTGMLWNQIVEEIGRVETCGPTDAK